MRSYTNSDGMSVEVSIEHLEKAVDIKLELQELSPSRRCNWIKHKKLMLQSGFDDSDSNEAYRCLIKDYQKDTGRLHSLPKHVDMIATSKLEMIKNLVHEERFEKYANQELLREINKYKKDISRTAVLAEELRNTIIDDIDFSVPHYIYKDKPNSSKNKGILVISDWHVGMTIDNCYGNSYNYEIANVRINKLIDETIWYCKTYSITDLHVIGLGDWVEHIYMRKNQSQDCEFGLTMQIAKAQKLIFKLLVSLAEYDLNVCYGGIAGNHDRGSGDKAQSFDDDNANVVITEGLKDMIKLVNSEKITLLDLDGTEDEINLEINNKKLKFTHGHNEWGRKKDKIKDFISMSQEFFDIWIHGHLHNFYQQEDDHSRMIVGVGCLQGRNNYAKGLGCATDASQALIVVREDGEVLPIRIGLQIQ